MAIALPATAIAASPPDCARAAFAAAAPARCEEFAGLDPAALRVFRAAGDTIQAAHVYDSLSEIAFERGDAAAAIALLDDALRALCEEGEGHDGVPHGGMRRHRLMLLAGRARHRVYTAAP